MPPQNGQATCSPVGGGGGVCVCVWISSRVSLIEEPIQPLAVDCVHNRDRPALQAAGPEAARNDNGHVRALLSPRVPACSPHPSGPMSSTSVGSQVRRDDF